MQFDRPGQEELNAENHSSPWQKLRELWQVKRKIIVPPPPETCQAILFLETLGKLFQLFFKKASFLLRYNA